ncbi:chain-length determining protein [Pseudomonas prosekii]|uniref:LPS O-antigen chain length determinant protein WzzB n=1 Tax=Pseudomonas prosekii TaxID=1148509 RepID=UPI000D6138B9|nr:Wzz/FepE/Etk N-terminal domain-containing protein [Pseudomonas prosekii]PWE44721.1 chain-length determining protein [Pseudomonas prosekii]
MQDTNNKNYQVAELDLFDITAVLWKKKRRIFAVTFLAGLVALAVAFMITPVYEAKLEIAPPTINNIANLNYGRTRESELAPYTVKDIYDVFLRNLQSESMRQSFFNSVYVKSGAGSSAKIIDRGLYEDFYKRLTIAPAGKDQNDRWVVSLRESDPLKAVELVSGYVAQAGEYAKQEVLRNAHSEAELRARILKSQIETLRDSGKKQREDTIHRLREALNVAKSINLDKPPVFTIDRSSEMAGDMGANLTYMRGSKALEAELINLETRYSDDPFIKELRGIEERLAYYQSLEDAPDDITVYRQDGIVTPPSTPVKPKKVVIVIIGLAAGAAAGCIIVLSSFFIRRRLSQV